MCSCSLAYGKPRIGLPACAMCITPTLISWEWSAGTVTASVVRRSCLLPGLRHYSPLKDRVLPYAKSKESECASRPATSENRPHTYRNWTEISMREAMNAVSEQGMSVAKASHVYGIPRTTLNDHILGKVLPGAKSGAPTILSASEEQDLVEFLLHAAKMGYAKTRKEVLNIASAMMQKRGIDKTVTHGWWNRLTCRHPLLTLRTPATLSHARARASSRECINDYFDLLERTLQESGLVEYPALIFNMDESGFPLDPKPLKSVHCSGDKNPYAVRSGVKSQVTVAACVSASGQSIPPLIIWKRKTMTADMAVGEIPGTQYQCSDKGWMNSTIFYSWFKKLFLRYAPASRPLLLLLDGHSSHYCPDAINLAAEMGVIIFTLPPNTTHLTQPLDKGVFGPFKQHWRRVCQDYQVSHPGQVISCYNFCQLFSKAWIESMTASNIITGFETTGIYPVDREAIQLPGESTVPQRSTIAPQTTFSPFKRFTEDELFSADEAPTPHQTMRRRPNSVTSIVESKTPVLKTQRVVPGATKILTKEQGELLCLYVYVLILLQNVAPVANVKCFVCDSATIVSFRPCGHSVLCNDCSKRAKKCPTCKVNPSHSYNPPIFLLTALVNRSQLRASEQCV